MLNCFIFDIETVPDVDSARRVHDLDDSLEDKDVADLLFSRQRAKSGNDFLRHHWQRIAAISVLLRSGDNLKVWTLGQEDSSEKEIIERFFAGLEKYTPTLVTWNGSGFDLPVLHYRSLIHGVTAARYWDTGDDDNSFRWNNYLNRFHQRHTDLMDVLAGYQGRAAAPLDEIASMLGFPGKMGMSGGKVWDEYLAGNIKGIRDYCETDVLNTYLVYLRYLMMSGKLFSSHYEEELQLLRDHLQEQNKPHFQAFLEAWTFEPIT